jgi:hypothetical protein
MFCLAELGARISRTTLSEENDSAELHARRPLACRWCGGAASPLVWDEAWPNRPASVICPLGAGGTDATARIWGRAENELKQPFTVVNRTGGSGALGHHVAGAAAMCLRCLSRRQQSVICRDCRSPIVLQRAGAPRSFPCRARSPRARSSNGCLLANEKGAVKGSLKVKCTQAIGLRA